MRGSEVVTIPQIRRVFSELLYANLPVVAVALEDLGYADDTGRLYRWDGAAWQPITTKAAFVLSGLLAGIPSVVNSLPGQIYAVLDGSYISVETGGAWVNEYNDSYFYYPDATAAMFRANAGAGTATNPQQINDNNTGNNAIFDAIGEFITVAFNAPIRIDQWRLFGAIGNVGDGRYTLEYLDVDDVYQTIVADIPSHVTADWTAFASFAEVITLGIRITCTTVDTRAGGGWIPELEVTHT